MNLSNVLQIIMSLEMPDKIKELVIGEALQANQELGEEGYVATLDLGVRWVLDGDRPMVVAVGWKVMQRLKEFQHNTVVKLLNVAFLQKLLQLNMSYSNRSEVPTLVAWTLSIVSSEAMEEAVRKGITHFLIKNVQGNMNVLVSASKLLCEHPKCVPVGSERARLCEVVIGSIAEVPMPKPQSTEVSQLVKQMGCVETLLVRLWKEEAEKYNEELIFRCLAVLHSALIDSTTDPCPALAAVLHLVDPYFIPKCVKAILQANHSHYRTLRTLCGWLCCWPCAARLNPWVLALMDGLEAQQQFDVLMDVAVATVEHLFVAIMLPAVRSGIIPVIWRICTSSRNSPHIFHKILNKIPAVTAQLLREDSDASRTCLQMVVNMCYAMIIAFPRSDSMYDPVIRAMKDCSSFLPPGQFASDTMPSWCSGIHLDYAMSLEAKERSSLSHVGLHNLGNTCYMNSVLQALFMTHRFRSSILSSDVKSQPLLAELQALFALLLYSRRQAISPTRLLAMARPPGFQPGYQQDSSEFLTYLLDVLHEQEKLRAMPKTAVIGVGGQGDAMEVAEVGAMTCWTTEEDLSTENILQYKACSLSGVTQAADDVQQQSNCHSSSIDSRFHSVCGDESGGISSSPVQYDSLVQQCFGGCLLISFKCLHCQAESVRTDYFRDIQLAFPPGCSPTEELNIQDLLDYFVSPEQLSGENKYHCDSCGGLQDARRTIQILQSPSHLVFTLKRFQFNSKTGQHAKLLHQVQYSETVELCKQSYRLYAAVVHSGSCMDTGHYYTVARDENLMWHVFNDSLVASCNPPWSSPDTPYILFYAQPEEKLQPVVDLLALPPLHSHLLELVNHDEVEWMKEMQSEEERHRRRQKQQPSPHIYPYKSERDNDGGGNPPGSCGGGNMDLSHNGFVF